MEALKHTTYKVKSLEALNRLLKKNIAKLAREISLNGIILGAPTRKVTLFKKCLLSRLPIRANGGW